MPQTSTELELLEVAPRSSAQAAVIDLHRRAKKTLGFMPDSGFTDRAAEGRLLAATIAGTLCGYVLFDLRGDRVKLLHLCVAGEHRRTGVARFLVDAVRARHPEKRAIVAECRRDYELHNMWRGLGFVPVEERRGRAVEDKPLVVWALERELPDLFTDLVERDDRELAAVDQNILEDLVNPRPQGAQTEALLEDWVTELVELAATDENLHELEQSNDASHRRKLRVQLTYFRRLTPPRREWEPLREKVEALVPEAEPGDCCHVARAKAAGARYFVTRDQDVLDAAERLERELEIEVVRPEELVTRLDRLRAEDRYEPSVLQGTEIVERPADEVDQEQLIGAFLNYGPEKRAHFLRIFRGALASPDEHSARVFSDRDGRLLGLVVRREHSDRLELELLRCGVGDRLGSAVARQLVYDQRERAANAGLGLVEVGDPAPSGPVERALPEEGYRRLDRGRWVCLVERGMVQADQLPELASASNLAEAAGLLERQRWPLKILGAGIPAFVVPIKPRWAEELFDTGLAEGTLFDRQTALGLAREHVYYRRPRNDRGMQAPARILWYVSTSRGHPIGHLRAVSKLAEVVVGKPDVLYRRFCRLGTYDRDQVRAAADRSGRVMALRFVDTELLQRPIGLEALRGMWGRTGRDFTVPSPQPVDEDMFAELYSRSSDYARRRETG
jgi:ribosomal protein S18 acetylase RimI-like enzyme/predicted nucleic acid-binding protein